ncbi:MAG: iron ABC transporter permease, partial [Deltaproteobacteria bacterium]|nr:iron ABC transporter permease [Deltaproteobacteria bacterium]
GMTILIPTFLLAIGWVLLLSPTIGIINQFFTKTLYVPLVINIYTMPGMAFVQGLSFMPIAFFMLSAVFSKMDPAMEEAAYANRIGGWKTFCRVTVPLSWPGLLAAIIYMFMLGIAVLEVPLIVGLPGQIHLFSSRVFTLTRASSSVPQYGIVGATSIVFLAVSTVAAYYYSRVIRKSYRYAVVSGKGYRPRLTELGPWKWLGGAFVLLYFCLSIVFPFASLIWMSLVPYIQAPSVEALGSVSLDAYRYLKNPMVLESFTNTTILIFTAPTLVMSLSILVSWIVVRSNMPGKFFLDRLATMPLAIPSIIIAVALIYIALIAGPFFPVYGTVWILVAAFVISHITFGTRTLNSAMIQIHKDLEEAAAVCGASPSKVMRRVIMPLIWAPLMEGWIWLFLLSFREVTMAATLYITDNAVLSTVVWVLWSNGEFDRAAAVSVVLAVLMGLLAVTARFIGTQLGGKVTLPT